ncbi:MAG: hypothetical protein FWE59_00145 [Oscillospiraceae bacterium]|nr:hypothetical protein [Oscillospiraceae bacterium]
MTLMTNYEENYIAARRQARRYLSEHAGDSGLLPVLSTVLGSMRPAGEYRMGLFEIPLKKVVGTCSASRRDSFAGNFMPLWPHKGEPAHKWMSVYRSHDDEGLNHPVNAYEYLGYYYIEEGHKRVSVLKASGAYSVSAEVIRVLPAWDADDHDIAVLYEYYRHNRSLIVRHMWFSRPGRLRWLFAEAARTVGGDDGPGKPGGPDSPGKPGGVDIPGGLGRPISSISSISASGPNDTDGADEWLNHCFTLFRKRYHAEGFGEWPMTTGDAFYTYVQIFGLHAQTDDTALRVELTACATQWRLDLLHLGASDPEGWVSSLSHKVPNIIAPKTRPAAYAFAFEGTPHDNETTHLHSIARYRLSVQNPELYLPAREGLPPGDEAWPAFEALLSEGPRYLFVPSPTHARLAWRAALLSPDTTVVHMGAEHPPPRRLATCWGNTQEPALLAGALAGLLTRTERIAVVSSPGEQNLCQAVAFAAGASLTAPRAQLLYHERDGMSWGWGQIRAAFAVQKADIAWLPATADPLQSLRTFPGVYAHLCLLSEGDASILDIVAGAAWHWSAFYLLLSSGTPRDGIPNAEGATKENLRLRLGMSHGLVDLHLAHALLPAGALRLLSILRQSIASGELDATGAGTAGTSGVAGAAGAAGAAPPDTLPDNLSVLSL